MATDENSRKSEIDLYTKGTEAQSAINKTFSKAIFRNSFLFEYKYFPQKKARNNTRCGISSLF
jgi:hypothetical protein